MTGVAVVEWKGPRNPSAFFTQPDSHQELPRKIVFTDSGKQTVCMWEALQHAAAVDIKMKFVAAAGT